MASKLIPPEEGPSPVRMIERRLKERLIGQDRAIREITRALERAYAGLKNPDHPVAVLAFFGPTGTGKTLAAEVLADSFPKRRVWRCSRYQECHFEITAEELQKTGEGSPKSCPAHAQRANAIVRVDRIELPNIWVIDCGGMGASLDHAVTVLVGSPPSYVGHDTPPLFTGKAPKVVLFDEAEKALLTESWHGGSSFTNILLKILDKGKIRNNHGEIVDFTNSVIILTGNLGAGEILREFHAKLGFATSGKPKKDFLHMTDEEIAEMNERIYSVVKEKAERDLAPEFLNRLDRLVVFHFLTRRDYEAILGNEIAKVQQRILQAVQGGKVPPFVLTFSPEATQFLLRESMADRRFGARPMIRVLEKRVVTPLSVLVNNKMIEAADHLEARVEKGSGEEDPGEKEMIVFYRFPPSEDPLLLSPPKLRRRRTSSPEGGSA